MSNPGGQVVRLEISPRTLAWLVAAIGGLWLLYRLWAVVLLVVVSLVLVGTFNPIIEALEKRGYQRRYALGLLMFGLALSAALFIFLTVPALIDDLTLILRDLPSHREHLIGILLRRNLTAPLGRVLSTVGLDQTLERVQNYLVGYSAAVMSAIGYGATTFVLALYLLVDGKRTRGALYAVVPRDYHMRLARIIYNLEQIVGGYMRGQVITSAVIGTFAFIVLTFCRVHNALALALLAAFFDIFPAIGAPLALISTVVPALQRGLTTSIVVLVFMFLYQKYESNILVPKVYGQAMRLSPAVVLLALIIGGTLLGMLGALLALPIAAGLQMIVKELGVALPGDDSNDPAERARDEKTEAAYDLMSSGATAPEAGQIANELAQGIRDADAWVAASKAKKKT